MALVALLRSRELSAISRRVAWAARPAPRGQEPGDAERQQGSLLRHLYSETFLVVFKCHSPRPRREPSSESWALGSPEVPAPGTRGRPRTGEPCCPERAVLADSGSPDAPGGRAAGPRALDGVDGAGWGTKAHALKFKSSESGPRICMLTMSQVRR